MVVAATGFFDGVHLGHRKVLSELCAVAAGENKKSAVITFWPHPRSVLQQQADDLRLLNSLEEKKELIREIGVNKVITLPFSKEFSRLSSEEFLRNYLKGKYGVSTLVIGYDHRLGHDVNRPQNEMMAAAAEMGIRVVRVEEFIMDGNVISSTKIRRLLSAGDVAGANKFLGYRYGLRGVVVSGQKIGRLMGFPTANMDLYDPLKVIPSNGVYAVYAQVADKVYMGVCNIGVRPTVSDSSRKTIETHILDFNEDIYGLDLKIEFVAKGREEMKFASVDLLKAQVEKDKEFARSLLSRYPVKKLR